MMLQAKALAEEAAQLTRNILQLNVKMVEPRCKQREHLKGSMYWSHLQC